MLNPRFSLLAPLGTAIALASVVGGCAAMQKARLDDAITVSPGSNPADFRRVHANSLTCDGPLCGRLNEDQIQSTLERGLTAACYEVVSDDELERYAAHFAERRALTATDGFGDIEFAGAAMEIDVPGFRFSMGAGTGFLDLEEDVREVVIEELDLNGVLTTKLMIGEPDSVTDFRSMVLEAKLVDAGSKSTVWHAQLDGNVMEDADVQQATTMLAKELAAAFKARTNACGAPTPPPASAVSRIDVVDDQIVVPGRVYFEPGSAVLSNRSHAMLDELANYLASSSSIRVVRIEGHTDDVGSETFNQRLSEKRVAAVAAYLNSKGIGAVTFNEVGLGESKPVVPNRSELDRSKNRRVEFFLSN